LFRVDGHLAPIGGEIALNPLEEVRTFSNPSGSLVVYRGGGKHYVSATAPNSGDPRNTFSLTESAIVDNPEKGDKLWAIPTNWKFLYRNSEYDNNVSEIYEVVRDGEENTFVYVGVPKNNHLMDAYFNVQIVGDLEITIHDYPVIGEDEIEKWKTIHGDDSDVVECLRTVRDSDETEKTWKLLIEEGVWHKMYNGGLEQNSFNRSGSGMDPWTHDVAVKPSLFLREIVGFDLGGEVRKKAAEGLHNSDFYPLYPAISIGIE
jgi:hypothetical protein